MLQTGFETTERKSPLRKLVRFFERSRDRWKAKYQNLKRERKRMQNQVRAVEKSREQWAARAKAAEQRVAELQELANKKCRAG
jgi:chromosome segregation ATPase